jgi:type II secretory pathway component PulM
MMTDFYQNLSKREQKLVILLTCLLLAVTCYLLIWKPLTVKNADLNEELSSKQDYLQRLVFITESVNNDVNAKRQQIESSKKLTLAAIVTQAVEDQRIENMQFVTKNTDNVKLTINNTSFIKIHQLLHELESKWGTQIENATIQQVQNTPDTVDVVLVITNNPLHPLPNSD